jgi:transposase-like protein
MFGFNSFQSVKSILAGIKLMHMIRKTQLNFAGTEEVYFADEFYALAGEIRSI